MRILPLMAALVLASCADSPTMPAPEVQQPSFDMLENQFRVPFSGAFTPCGDIIAVEGEAHWFIKVRDSHTFQFFTVTGTGTRGSYEFVFHQTDVMTTFPFVYAPDFTHISTVRLIGKGSAPNATTRMHWAMHTTPDGRITAEIKQFEMECK